MILSYHMLTHGWRHGLNDDARRLTGLRGLSLLSANCRVPTAYCQLLTAHCPLTITPPTAYCILPTAYCPPPTAECLLPTPNSQFPTPHPAAYCSGRIRAAAGCAVMVSQSARTRSHS
jgi:hypothetical protein